MIYKAMVRLDGFVPQRTQGRVDTTLPLMEGFMRTCELPMESAIELGKKLGETNKRVVVMSFEETNELAHR